MTNRRQFGRWLPSLAICVALASPGLAQKPRTNAPQPRANANQSRPPKQEQRQQKQQQQGARQQEKQASQDAERNANRPPQGQVDRANPGTRPNTNANRPPNAYTPPPARTLTPQERQKNEQQFKKLPPQRQQEIRDGEKNWRRLTPDQQAHIKNDVMPKWKQLSPQRQKAIHQRLGVLQNMPESARNQHLNDPNFTKGMNEEDKAMLRDLSHLHVGGAPEPPNE